MPPIWQKYRKQLPQIMLQLSQEVPYTRGVDLE